MNQLNTADRKTWYHMLTEVVNFNVFVAEMIQFDTYFAECHIVCWWLLKRHNGVMCPEELDSWGLNRNWTGVRHFCFVSRTFFPVQTSVFFVLQRLIGFCAPASGRVILKNHVYKFGCHASMNKGFFSRLANGARPRGGSSSAYLPRFCSTPFLPSFCSAFVSSAVAATNFN